MREWRQFDAPRGQTARPYGILSPLGAGGMGEVDRARDTRLGRDVAVKVLPDAFARNPDRRTRFLMTPDGKGYAYDPTRDLSALSLVRGLS